MQARIKETKETMDRLKASPILIFGLFLAWFGGVLSDLLGARRVMAAFLAQGLPDLMLSNVPGPTAPVGVSGVRVEAMQAFINNPNMFTAFSYNGKLRFAYTATSDQLDAEKMMRFVDAEAELLLQGFTETFPSAPTRSVRPSSPVYMALVLVCVAMALFRVLA